MMRRILAADGPIETRRNHFAVFHNDCAYGHLASSARLSRLR
jgi:hypothetical protein